MWFPNTDPADDLVTFRTPQSAFITPTKPFPPPLLGGPKVDRSAKGRHCSHWLPLWARVGSQRAREGPRVGVSRAQDVVGAGAVEPLDAGPAGGLAPVWLIFSGWGPSGGPSTLGALCSTPCTLCSTPTTLCSTPCTLCSTPTTLCSTPVTSIHQLISERRWWTKACRSDSLTHGPRRPPFS